MTSEERAGETDLIGLIYHHLKDNGYKAAASVLKKHAPLVAASTANTSLWNVYNKWAVGCQLSGIKPPNTSSTPSTEKARKRCSKAGREKKNRVKSPTKNAKKKKKSGSVPCPSVPVTGDVSDSDSSLDMDKWKTLAMIMTDEQMIARQEAIASVDPSGPTVSPAKKEKNVKKPKSKASPKDKKKENSAKPKKKNTLGIDKSTNTSSKDENADGGKHCNESRPSSADKTAEIHLKQTNIVESNQTPSKTGKSKGNVLAEKDAGVSKSEKTKCQNDSNPQTFVKNGKAKTPSKHNGAQSISTDENKDRLLKQKKVKLLTDESCLISPNGKTKTTNEPPTCPEAASALSSSADITEDPSQHSDAKRDKSEESSDVPSKKERKKKKRQIEEATDVPIQPETPEEPPQTSAMAEKKEKHKDNLLKHKKVKLLTDESCLISPNGKTKTTNEPPIDHEGKNSSEEKICKTSSKKKSTCLIEENSQTPLKTPKSKKNKNLSQDLEDTSALAYSADTTKDPSQHSNAKRDNSDESSDVPSKRSKKKTESQPRSADKNEIHLKHTNIVEINQTPSKTGKSKVSKTLSDDGEGDILPEKDAGVSKSKHNGARSIPTDENTDNLLTHKKVKLLTDESGLISPNGKTKTTNEAPIDHEGKNSSEEKISKKSKSKKTKILSEDLDAPSALGSSADITEDPSQHSDAKRDKSEESSDVPSKKERKKKKRQMEEATDVPIQPETPEEPPQTSATAEVKEKSKKRKHREEDAPELDPEPNPPEPKKKKKIKKKCEQEEEQGMKTPAETDVAQETTDTTATADVSSKKKKKKKHQEKETEEVEVSGREADAAAAKKKRKLLKNTQDQA
ncbi:axoneme-associated protein mst101(2)-like [Denticeps clupeoides]|uniref:LisH domain-containing protein n=1 Tax=Denticeps clupeoides TaxID=299321 RepID=A0AAY4CL34_9TELE|nr:axoneme-associated protein mst101(2)-like [Denticeps clupeoides]